MSRQRYLLGGSPGLIRALAEIFAADDEIELIEVVGPAAEPERLVASMPPERAGLLRGALGSHLVIEPDEYLHPSA